MSLPDFDTMLAMTDAELVELYNTELEAILAKQDPETAARNRAIAGGKVMRLQRIKNPIMRAETAYYDMMDSFRTLNELLQEVSGNGK